MNICCLIICFVLKGVFSDDVKSLMEGDSVTLRCEFPNIQTYELILWTFGPDSTRIAQINKVAMKISIYDDVLNGKFRDRLKLDQTGSLTITNTTTEHTGRYELQVFGIKLFSKKFSITVYAPLPVPVIHTNSSQCLSSPCSVLCSVVNVSHVTLSWLKGNRLLSSISASDFSISLSLPLEVEEQEKNNYICVINNSITHQTTHLDISDLCQTCEVDASHMEKSFTFSHMVLICVGITVVLTVLAVVGMIGIYFKYRKTNNLGQTPRHECIQMLQNVSPGEALNEHKLKIVSVSLGETVILNTGVTAIQTVDVLQWRFAEANTNGTNPFVVFATLNEAKTIDYNCHSQTFRDRVQMDQQTGYLTIKDIRRTDLGIYKLNISRNKGTVISKTFIIQELSEQTDASEA